MEAIVTKIDPSLTYRRRLRPSALLVYEVEKEGSIYVLKLTNCEWLIEFIEREREILVRAAEVPGITHLVHNYEDVGDYKRAILKEFFEGETLLELKHKIGDVNLQKRLENTIRDIHSLGVAGLDLCQPNIVLSPDRQDVSLIDLDCGLFSEHIGYSEFEKLKSKDRRDLEVLIFE